MDDDRHHLQSWFGTELGDRSPDAAVWTPGSGVFQPLLQDWTLGDLAQASSLYRSRARYSEIAAAPDGVNPSIRVKPLLSGDRSSTFMYATGNHYIAGVDPFTGSEQDFDATVRFCRDALEAQAAFACRELDPSFPDSWGRTPAERSAAVTAAYAERDFFEKRAERMAVQWKVFDKDRPSSEPDVERRCVMWEQMASETRRAVRMMQRREIFTGRNREQLETLAQMRQEYQVCQDEGRDRACEDIIGRAQAYIDEQARVGQESLASGRQTSVDQIRPVQTRPADAQPAKLRPKVGSAGPKLLDRRAMAQSMVDDLDWSGDEAGMEY